MHLLDQEAPGLAGKLQMLSPEHRRRVLAKAALAASRQIRDLEPRIQQLLDVAVKDNALSDEQVGEVRAYTELADDRYFTAQEQGAAEAIWGNWFAKARLGAAITDAFQGTTLQDAALAAYELCFTSDHKEATIALIEAEIQAATKNN